MIKITTTLRKWGNSVGIVIPKDELKNTNLKPDQKVTVIVRKRGPTKGKDIFGMFPNLPKNNAAVWRELDKELDSKFFQ